MHIRLIRRKKGQLATRTPLLDNSQFRDIESQVVTQDGLLPCGNLRCGIDDLLRRRRGAHKAHKAQKKGHFLPEDAARQSEDAGRKDLLPIEVGPISEPSDFEKLDTDMSGDISFDEFISAGFSLPDPFETIDRNGDGSIDTNEFTNGGRFRRSTHQSLKGDTSDDQTTYVAAKSFHASKANKGQKSADFKGRLETFKAGYKAARDQYHEAKAQFKATTKALIHAKFSKGPKAKGHHVKAAAPTIRVRYVKTCQDEPRKICSQTPRQECHKEVVPLCKFEPRETCVPKKKCKSWPKKNCGMVHKETCLPFQLKSALKFRHR